MFAKKDDQLRIQAPSCLVYSIEGMNVTQLRPNTDVRAASDEALKAHPLEAAFARYQDELLGTLFYLVGNREDARDALQEAFIKCWRHREMLPEVKNLKAWIFRIALNTGRDVRETAWRRKRKTMPEDEAMIQSRFKGPEQEFECDERLTMLRGAVRELRSEEQEVFLLRQNGNMTYEEIAEAIGIPTGTVKTRMRLALTKLRQVLATE